MGFLSFAGRIFFASVFLLSAYQEFNAFGTNGGPAAQALRPRINAFRNHATSILGVEVPKIEAKHIIAANISLKGIGSLLFIINSPFGASLLLLHLALMTPVLYDFYNYDVEKPEFSHLVIKFAQNLALAGALLFYLGMKNSIAPKRQGKKKAPKPKTL